MWNQLLFLGLTSSANNASHKNCTYLSSYHQDDDDDDDDEDDEDDDDEDEDDDEDDEDDEDDDDDDEVGARSHGDRVTD